MTSTTDAEYLDTKRVKLNQKQIPKVFTELIEWVDQKYKVRTINIYYDRIIPFDRPRIQLIYESREEASKMRDHTGNFNSKIQYEIASKFADLVKSQNLNDQFDTKNVLVVFSDFSWLAVSDASMSIPKEELQTLMNKYKKGIIWDIHQGGTGVNIFFYTEMQINEHKNDPEILEIKDEYFRLIKRYDLFNYIKESHISFDSKENFDKNYDSNWFYYYR